MRKILIRLSLILPFAISMTGFVGMSFKALQTLGQAEAKAMENQMTTLRELTDIEKYKLFLLESLDYNVNEYHLLSKVVWCESKWKPDNYNPRTDDYGLFQINASVWDEKAEELGLDYKNNWQDNIKLGIWIFKNSGIKNWLASKKCWQ